VTLEGPWTSAQVGPSRVGVGASSLNLQRRCKAVQVPNNCGSCPNTVQHQCWKNAPCYLLCNRLPTGGSQLFPSPLLLMDPSITCPLT
jgi:hypothetical protein